MDKVALVTGAGGFIGSHLCERLFREGFEVIGVDNFCSGSRSNIERLEHVENAVFTFLELDVTDSEFESKLNDILGDKKLTHIFHLASPASPKDFFEMAIGILETNSVGTVNMVKLAHSSGARLLFTSTSEVYGDPNVSPQSEEYKGNVSTVGLRSCYDEGKRFAESYIVNFGRSHNIDYRIARIFNTYGPFMRKDDGRVLPNFIEQFNNDTPLTIYGDGSQTRSFCYVEDTVDGIIALMDHGGFSEPAQSNDPLERIMNIGNQHEISILELAESLAEVMGKELNTVALEKQFEDDPKQRCPDISKAQRVIGFEPKTELKEGLKRTLEQW